MMTHLLLRGLPEASQSGGPRTARYGLVGFLDLRVEVGGLRAGAGAGAALALRLLLGRILRVNFFLNVIVCVIHAGRCCLVRFVVVRELAMSGEVHPRGPCMCSATSWSTSASEARSKVHMLHNWSEQCNNNELLLLAFICRLCWSFKSASMLVVPASFYCECGTAFDSAMAARLSTFIALGLERFARPPSRLPGRSAWTR